MVKLQLMDWFLKYLSITALLSMYVLYTSAELIEFLKTDDEVSGIYANKDGSLGIKFVCREGYMQIETLNNITLFHTGSFHEVNKRMARSVYILNGEYLQHKHTSHRHLDRSVGDTTKPFNETISDLLQMEEITLLEGASRAVGRERGVTGKNTPIILSFHMFALKVAQILGTSMTNELNQKSTMPPQKKYRRCTGCLKYQKYRKCNGLCGLKCVCFEWVCGDCCYHQACFDHDACCGKHGYISSQCFLTPSELSNLRSACDEPFIC